MAIIWKETAKNGTETKHGKEFVANTEPSAQYEDRTEYVEKT